MELINTAIRIHLGDDGRNKPDYWNLKFYAGEALKNISSCIVPDAYIMDSSDDSGVE